MSASTSPHAPASFQTGCRLSCCGAPGAAHTRNTSTAFAFVAIGGGASSLFGRPNINEPWADTVGTVWRIRSMSAIGERQPDRRSAPSGIPLALSGHWRPLDFQFRQHPGFSIRLAWQSSKLCGELNWQRRHLFDVLVQPRLRLVIIDVDAAMSRMGLVGNGAFGLSLLPRPINLPVQQRVRQELAANWRKAEGSRVVRPIASTFKKMWRTLVIRQSATDPVVIFPDCMHSFEWHDLFPLC